ncbi:MAG: radical SAM protein [Dissulfuribacterales bacterium]
MKKPNQIPYLVYANEKGQIFDFPGLRMAGRSGNIFHPIQHSDLIPLPEGSELFVLPNRMPIGWDDEKDEMVVVDSIPGQSGGIRAVAAFIAPAHTQLAMAAFQREKEDLPPLPLFAYTAVGWYADRFWVPAFRSDLDTRQDSKYFDINIIRKNTLRRMKETPHNRLIQHLGKCSLTYGCPAAKNLFLNRYEAPLPTSPSCNARCVGCISLQPQNGPPATQERIRFVPTPQEIAEIAIPHLKQAPKAIVSFGQGCEGEPLLQAESLRKSIELMRQATPRGTINLNTNASRPLAVERLKEAGLNSIRISLNSIREDYYHAYYRPVDYSQKDVISSCKAMKEAGGFVSLNYFIFPGLTDELKELERLEAVIAETGLDFIQLRNHNIDPDWYLKEIHYKYTGHRLGIKNMIKILKKRFPKLGFGYFNPYLGASE